MIETIYRSVRNEYDRTICRGGWGGGHVISKGRGRENEIDSYNLGHPVSFNKKHLSSRVRIIIYKQVTLNPVKSKTPSLDMKLKKSSIMASVCFALLIFSLSNFQLWPAILNAEMYSIAMYSMTSFSILPSRLSIYLSIYLSILNARSCPSPG